MFKTLAFALLLIAASASAAPGPIDSTASGTYLGSDRVCRVVLYRWMTNWVSVGIRCVQFAGEQTESLTTVYAPDNCPQGGAYNLNPWPPEVAREYLSLRSYDDVGQTLQIVKGFDPTDVYNGVGTAEAWYRIGFSPSPAPYSCSTTPPAAIIDPLALARYCRQHPTVAACRD